MYVVATTTLLASDTLVATSNVLAIDALCTVVYPSIKDLQIILQILVDSPF